MKDTITREELQDSICKFCKHPFRVKGGAWFSFGAGGSTQGGLQIYCGKRSDGCLSKYKIIDKCEFYEFNEEE